MNTNPGADVQPPAVTHGGARSRAAGALALLAAIGAFAIVSLLPAQAPVQSSGPGDTSAPVAAAADQPRPRQLAFEPNRGQTNAPVQYIVRASGYTAFLDASTATFALRGAEPGHAPLRMRLVGADPSAPATATGELPGKVNYITGAGPARDLVDIPTYAGVRYSGVYPGIDLVYYGNQGRLEYDFVVAPGADPDAVRLAFDGAAATGIDEHGALVLHTAGGTLRQPSPIVYQERDGARQPIAGVWVQADGQQVGFRVGPYDRARPLIIDPVLLYSTYLGGIGDDAITRVALDAAGHVFVAGVTTSPDFPGAPPRLGGEVAAFVTRLGAGGHVVYSTYLLDTDDRGATGLAVDAAGNAYVTGQTGAWHPSGRFDVFVARLDATGNTAQPGGYFFTFGGDTLDWGQRIAVDVAGHAYVAGVTLGDTFPATPQAFQTAPAGEMDGFVAKVNVTGDALVYATLLGGSALDSANGIAIDAAGYAYVTGSTESADFPVTANAFQRERGGCFDGSYGRLCSKTGFVTRISPAGDALAYSTHLGGAEWTQASVAVDIAVDAGGHAYVTGSTTATDFPTTPGVVQPNVGERLCFFTICTEAFVTKLAADGSRLVYSTYLVGDALDAGAAIAVDREGSAYVAGTTVSRYFPNVNAFQPNPGTFQDAFVVKLNRDATRFVYSSYLGGANLLNSAYGGTVASAIAVDAAGRAWVAGQTYTTDFPTTPGALQGAPASLEGCRVAGIFPCSDGFLTQVAADGPGVQQAIAVTAPAEAVAGARVDVQWSGIPAPNADDRIHLYPLGHSHESVYGGWATTGAANGTTSIELPVTLASGWYEVRLWSGDWTVYSPLARSEPIRVRNPLDPPSGGGANGGGSSVMPFSGGGGAAGAWVLALAVLPVLRRLCARRSGPSDTGTVGSTR
jgi:hypothetical protein